MIFFEFFFNGFPHLPADEWTLTYDQSQHVMVDVDKAKVKTFSFRHFQPLPHVYFFHQSPPARIIIAFYNLVNVLKLYYDESMAKLIFKIQKAGNKGRSPIEVILQHNKKIYIKTTDNTDNLLSTLDTLLKRSKIELESVKDIKIETHKEAGLTSTRIIKSIVKALRFL